VLLAVCRDYLKCNVRKALEQGYTVYDLMELNALRILEIEEQNEHYEQERQKHGR
jgi:hypothetical protein